MAYYVIGSDGARYGPEDLNGLMEWARQHRVAATTSLIDARTGRQLRAGDLPELAAIFGQAAQPAAERVRIERPATPVNVPPMPVVPVPYSPGQEITGPKSKVGAGLLALLLPGLGAHRFYLGYPGIGVLQIVVSLVTCGIGSIWGIVEGILCLTGSMRDSEGRLLRD